jgi:ribosome-binding protein aMBF1 (putative translation factor)
MGTLNAPGVTPTHEDSRSFEESLLRDPDVKFGFDNYEMLKQIGAFVRDMRKASDLSQESLEAASGIDQSEISRLEAGAMERGPSLLTLVRLAHAAGQRLVIGLEDPEGGTGEPRRVVTL